MDTEKESLSTSEWERAYEHWSRVAREEFTRAQIAETAADYRDYSSPVWWAMHDELQRRDSLDMKRRMRSEVSEAKKRDKYALRRKLRLKNQLLTEGKMFV